jgi:hypothetical protein
VYNCLASPFWQIPLSIAPLPWSLEELEEPGELGELEELGVSFEELSFEQDAKNSASDATVKKMDNIFIGSPDFFKPFQR